MDSRGGLFVFPERDRIDSRGEAAGFPLPLGELAATARDEEGGGVGARWDPSG